ncbi:17982_t:CDS:2 [Funneliformis geosporum]|nr:17982_t:CDS:2 [Funneliformis geosporum]
MTKTKLKTGDQVKVISGKHRGTIDFISRLDPQEQLVYLKKVSRKKYDKSTPDSKKKSELKEIMTPLHISNVAYWLEDKKKTTKIGYQATEKEKDDQIEKTKVRISRKFKDKKGSYSDVLYIGLEDLKTSPAYKQSKGLEAIYYPGTKKNLKIA